MKNKKVIIGALAAVLCAVFVFSAAFALRNTETDKGNVSKSETNSSDTTASTASTSASAVTTTAATTAAITTTTTKTTTASSTTASTSKKTTAKLTVKEIAEAAKTSASGSATIRPKTTAPAAAKSTTKKSTTKSSAKSTTKSTTKATAKSTTKATTKSTTAAPVSHTIDGQVPKGAKVASTYFDDAVFVGDSISKMLEYYEAKYDRLGKAKFLTAVSLSAQNAQWSVDNKNAVHPKYNGQKMRIEDSIPLTKANKVYIMLGMNDIENVGIDKGYQYFEQLCGKIKAKAPNVQFYVESVTPRVNLGSKSLGRLTNANITKYNKKLSQLCRQNGWYFINVAETMFDSKGYLKSNYCSDASSMGMHMTYTGCAAWVDYLYTHAP